MRALIVKSYRYSQVRDDARFSFEAAFRRINGVLDVVREAVPDAQTLVVVPAEELEDCKRHLKLHENERLHSGNAADDAFFGADEMALVFDEQGFYASTELVGKVISAAKGKCAAWEDPEGMLWSFNYTDSCRFFAAPIQAVKKHIGSANGFAALQEAVLGECEGVRRYTITPGDIPPVYARAARYNPYPYHFYLEPTSKCNSRCIMCPFHSTDPAIAKGRVYLGDGGDDMPVHIFKRHVDEIASIGWNYLPHYRHSQITAQLRGEPTLAPGFRTMCAYIKEKGLRLSFTTNGSALHKDNLAGFLIDAGVDEIIVSIDGDEEEYSRIRPQLSYAQVVKNIKTLRRLRDESGRQAPSLYTKRVHTAKSTDKADRDYIEKFSPIVDWTGIAFENYDDFKTEGKGYSSYFFEVEDAKRLPCVWAMDVSVVKSNGMVDMCFGASEHYIGDVNKKGLLEILKDAPLRRMIIENHSSGDYADPPFCHACTSWKHNYHRLYEEDGYMVKSNPVLTYWKKKDAPRAEKQGRTGKDMLKNIFKKLIGEHGHSRA